MGAILIGLLQVLQFNAHEIYETRQSSSNTNKIIGSGPVYIGAGVYKSAAYFNHSCYPSVVRYFIGTSIVLATSHPLEPGDVIFENYGPIYSKQTFRERQRNLRSRYWFLCDCIACREDWPVLESLCNKSRLRFVFYAISASLSQLEVMNVL